MSHIQIINPPSLAPAVGFAHAAAHGDFVWLGGQIGSDSHGRITDPGDMLAQFTQAIENVDRALRAANCTPHDVVKITYFVTDVGAYRTNLAAIGRAYRRVFGKHFPASTLVGVTELFAPQAMVEIECLAVRSGEIAE